MAWKTLDALNPTGQRVLVRVDINVPVQDGKVTDTSRIEHVKPTVLELAGKGAKVVLLAHFERPKGKRVPELSLAHIRAAVETVFGKPVTFADDCVGDAAEAAVAALKDGEVLLLENLRFHAGEEKNDPAFAAALAKLGDSFVNDAFSVSHRAHASVEALPRLLPAYAGRGMQAELEALEKVLENPERPVVAIVGGAKISTKVDLIENLLQKVETVVIGGAMANTFLAAKGLAIGKSLVEPDAYDTARAIMEKARFLKKQLILPEDVVVAKEFKANVSARTIDAREVEPSDMILDIGPNTLAAIAIALEGARTCVWNGPLGAFEVPPFDLGTANAARHVAMLTRVGRIVSVAGGGDTQAALHAAAAADGFTYISTAGGAFLEWLEGKTLPGVAALG